LREKGPELGLKTPTQKKDKIGRKGEGGKNGAERVRIFTRTGENF